MLRLIELLIAVPSVALISVFYEQYKKTQKISFLSDSELDSFNSLTANPKSRKKKEHEIEKELDSDE